MNAVAFTAKTTSATQPSRSQVARNLVSCLPPPLSVVYSDYPAAISRDTPDARSRQTSEIPTEDGEEGEAMEAMNDEDAAMMAMMGLNGFGTTKVRIALHRVVQPSYSLLTG